VADVDIGEKERRRTGGGGTGVEQGIGAVRGFQEGTEEEKGFALARETAGGDIGEVAFVSGGEPGGKFGEEGSPAGDALGVGDADGAADDEVGAGVSGEDAFDEIGGGEAVGVEEGDEGGGGMAQGEVACGAGEEAMGRGEEADVWEAGGDKGWGGVGRGIGDKDFEAGDGLGGEGLESGGDGGVGIIGDDDDGELRGGEWRHGVRVFGRG
jgi:hypothetical protein